MVATGYLGGDPSKVDVGGYVLGDVLAADVTGVLQPVPIGASTEVLTVDPGEPTSVDWEPGGSGGGGTPSNTVVTETTFGQASAVGAGTAYARDDHTHGTPAAPTVPSASATVVTETTFAQADTAGAAATFSRGDHTHGTPLAPTAVSVGADPAGSAAAAGAAAVTTANAFTTSSIAALNPARFRGDWSAATTYQPGDIVVHGDGTYGALLASTNTPPTSPLALMTGNPSTVETSDSGDYEFANFFNVTARARLTSLCFRKVATQTAVPHTLRLWDIGISTATPILTIVPPVETAAQVGEVCAPIIADILPGRSYACSYSSGLGSEAGYAYTPSFSYPVASGVMTLTGGGFSNVVGSVASVGGTSNFWVYPKFANPLPLTWRLIGRFDPVIVGSTRAYVSPILPT